MSSQKTQRQKLNSYWVMNSLGDKICPPAASKSNNDKFAMLVKIENMCLLDSPV